MKICMISPYYPPHIYPDGIGDYTQRLCEEMVKLGHEITILVSDGYKAEDQRTHELLKIIPFTSHWNFNAFLKLYRLCKTEKFDVVNLQYSPPLYQTPFKLLYPFIRLHCPAVVSLHTLIGGKFVNNLAALAFILFCTEAISTNEEVSYLIKKYLPCKENILIPIGSNIAPLEQNEATIKARKKDRLILTHFGLFYPGKGVETILDAVAELKQELDDFQVFMLGGKWPGAEDYYHSLQQRAQRLGIDEEIRWLGYLPAAEISRYLSMTDILLLPYDRGISIRRGSYMVGLAHGLPIISTYAKIESEYIKENENIVLVPPRDPVALKEKILELSQNSARRKRLGENAQGLLAEFSWPNIAAKMTQVFEEV